MTADEAPHIWRAQTAFEAAIDRATGSHGPKRVRRTVTMECPTCQRTAPAPMDPSDPPATAKVRAVCDRCPDDAAEVTYFDAQGRQIDCDGRPM